jgi:hypothetical protein
MVAALVVHPFCSDGSVIGVGMSIFDVAIIVVAHPRHLLVLVLPINRTSTCKRYCTVDPQYLVHAISHVLVRYCGSTEQARALSRAHDIARLIRNIVQYCARDMFG